MSGDERSAAEFWDDRYREKGAIWSGNVNAPLAERAEGLEPGTALDLGCGEGADAVWLAEHGWRVTAAETLETLDLDRSQWELIEAGISERETVSPDGEPATLKDNVIFARRLAG